MTEEEKQGINKLCQDVFNNLSMNYNLEKGIPRDIIFRNFNLSSLNQKEVFEYLKKKGVKIVKSEKGTELENSFSNKKVTLHNDIVSNETRYYIPPRYLNSSILSEEDRTIAIKKIARRPYTVSSGLIEQVQEKIATIQEMVDIKF